jgi:hypothetical protein
MRASEDIRNCSSTKFASTEVGTLYAKFSNTTGVTPLMSKSCDCFVKVNYGADFNQRRKRGSTKARMRACSQAVHQGRRATWDAVLTGLGIPDSFFTNSTSPNHMHGALNKDSIKLAYSNGAMITGLLNGQAELKVYYPTGVTRY